MSTAPRLIDVCPGFAEALDEFESLALADEFEAAADAWARAQYLAREFRRPKIVAPA